MVAKIFVPVFFVAFSAASLLTPLTRRLGLKYGFIDVPGPRRKHAEVTSRLGGVALYAAFVMAVALTLLLVGRDDPAELTRLIGVLIGSTVVFLLGLWDDKRELSPAPQLLGQFLAAIIAVRLGLVIEVVTSPFGRPITLSLPLAVVFTLFWMVGMMNTVNWLDGLDGLAAGVAIIASFVLFWHTFTLRQYSLAVLPLALAGSAMGFLPYNFHPARVFMGSCGSLVLGFALAALAVIGGAKMATTLLVMGIPILDVAWQIASRLRSSRSPLRADLGHLHYRLSAWGLSQRQVVLLFYLFCAFFGLLALILPSGLYKLYALLGMGGLLVMLILITYR